MDVRHLGERFKKFARTKFFIALASVAVFLTVAPVVLASMGRTDILRSTINLLATPFKKAAVFCGDAVDGFIDYFTEFDRLRAENAALREELNEAQSKNDAADAALAENEWLKSFLLFSQEHPELILIEARAVGRESGDHATAFTINKGSADGIKRNQCVITPDGLVGYVCEVGLNYAKVNTLISIGTSIGAICDRSGAYGTLEGTYGRDEKGFCKMICSNSNADVSAGDVIKTSGVGSVYPYGLTIGRVASVEIDEYSRELIIYVETMVDFSDVSRVIVLGEGAAEVEQ